MPDIKFECPHCGQRMTGDDSLHATVVQCPNCDQRFIVPDPPMKQAKLISDTPPAQTTDPRDRLIALLRVFYILCGLPLGYVISYFFQPSLLRGFMSLGDYVRAFPRIVFTASEETSSVDLFARLTDHITRSVSFTAYIGMAVGIFLMGIVTMIITRASSLQKE